jgi:hypothetical protein
LRAQLALREPIDLAAEGQIRANSRTKSDLWDGDRKFLNEMNRGVELMQEADVQRVRSIGTGNTWRNLDGMETDFLSADEMENLCIRGGTLTAAERNIINYHIVATNKMLEQLPWPRHLRNVPEYAGGHHERMDGKGYPKGLTRDQMSVQARVMGIADIFEALTASDRPYKRGMKLSQAMDIMHKLRSSGHIDSDLFDVFVQEKVYLQYAQQYLDPWQIDEINPGGWM